MTSDTSDCDSDSETNESDPFSGEYVSEHSETTETEEESRTNEKSEGNEKEKGKEIERQREMKEEKRGERKAIERNECGGRGSEQGRGRGRGRRGRGGMRTQSQSRAERGRGRGREGDGGRNGRKCERGETKGERRGETMGDKEMNEKKKGKGDEGEGISDGHPEWREAFFCPEDPWYASKKNNGEIRREIEEAYEEVVTWKRNVFRCPSGKVGKEVVKTLREAIDWWTKKTGKEAFAWKAVLVLLPLLFQKPEGIKAAGIKDLVEKRLQKWKAGEIWELLEEARYLQKKRAARWASSENENISKAFARRVGLGKVKGAMKMLCEKSQDGGIVCNEKTKAMLREKHPAAAEKDERACLKGEYKPVPECLYEKLDEFLVHKAALMGRGAAGPSGLDSDDWRAMLATRGFGDEGKRLRQAVAEAAQRLCTEFVDPDAVEALLRGREVPLPKGKDDIRPIGIGETLRRIMGRCIMKVVADDVQGACGATQVCAGFEGGCEAAIHATRQMFQEDETEAALLVDAKNAFNSLNRKVALHNIARLCPAFYPFLVNCYRRPAKLHVSGCEDIMWSEEGTTQGDPCGMAMYALGVVPLIREEERHQTEREKVGEERDVRQVWFADDATGVGKLEGLKRWWDRLAQTGSSYGYHVNEGKSVLVVKRECLEKAHELFKGIKIVITSDGNRHLGAALGTSEFVEAYVREKAKKIARQIDTLAEIAEHEPQAAFTGYVVVVKHKWTFLQRTIPNRGEWYVEIEERLRSNLIPKLIGKVVGDIERRILGMPAREGGMGLSDPCQNNIENHQMSMKITEGLQILIKNQDPNLLFWDRESQKQVKRNEMKKKREREKSDKEALMHEMSSDGHETLRRAVEVASEKGASSWLTNLPLDRYGFTLGKRDFHDALAVRYGWMPADLWKKCMCGKQNNVAHAISCKLGGFPVMVHNEIRDVLAEMAVEAGCKDVATEYHLQEIGHRMEGGERETGEILGDDARMDVVCLGLWGRLQRAFLDVRVTNPMAPSNLKKSVDKLKRENEKEKRRAYGRRVREVERGSFTPMVFTTGGGCGKECTKVLQRLGMMIAMRNGEEQSVVMAGLRARIGFSLLRGAILGLRGHRRWRRGMKEEVMEYGVMKEEISMRD